MPLFGQRGIFAGTRHGRYAKSGGVCADGVFAGTRHKRDALHVESNAASGHEQRGNQLGRSSWLSLAGDSQKKDLIEVIPNLFRNLIHNILILLILSTIDRR